MSSCTLCPRSCGADRNHVRGVCGCTDVMEISRIMLHTFEEPCICTGAGSGAVFFCGCPLGCVYCQNAPISRREKGKPFAGSRKFSVEQLAREFVQLQEKGASCIDLVSPTQYTHSVIETVRIARENGLCLPVVWNTGGYETRENIRRLDGTVDVYLTDMKYFSPELSSALSAAPDYFERAFESLLEMVSQVGEPTYENGLMKRGVIVRHLVLPGCRSDSMELLRRMAEASLQKSIVLSLMSQYTPEFFTSCKDEKLSRSMRRRVTSFEYDSVASLAAELGFTGYGQERSSAETKYTPSWGRFEY